jgi:uncharacterized protein YfaS (alpha-2-macroglobulin family)
MKTNFAIQCAAVAFTAAFIHITTTSLASPQAKPESSRIIIAPNTGELADLKNSEADSIRVTFPTPMVDLDKVKRGGQPSPIVFEPVVESRWMWLSQTEGVITFPDMFVDEERVAAEMRNVAHRAKLRPGLKDNAGHSIDPQNWGAEFKYEKFTLRGLEFLNAAYSDLEESLAAQKAGAQTDTSLQDDVSRRVQTFKGQQQERDENEEKGIAHRELDWALVARPRVRLEFSRDVSPEDVQRSVYFQDIDTHQRFPVEVNLEERQPVSPQGWMLVEPIAPLPPRRTFLLVIDPVKEPATNESLPHLRVVPAGTTYPLVIRRLVGLNQPLKGPFIRVTPSHKVDPDATNLKRISVQPAVANLRIAAKEIFVEISGDFNTRDEYRVIIEPGLKSTESLDLEKQSSWKVHFHPKRPAIILPQEEIFQRASIPMASCSFVQVNTAPLEWKIVKIPRNMIKQVRGRLREFEEELSDSNGDRVRDSTGESQFKPTELLIPVLGLPIVASGTVAGSDDDKETLRLLEWKPNTTEPGVYLLEIAGQDLKGRQIGNRSIISRSDWVISRIETSAGDIVRVAGMKDGKPVSAVPVEVLDAKAGASIRTDVNGEALFGEGLHDDFLVGTADQACLQLVNLPEFASGQRPYYEEEKAQVRSVIVTDRNVYRPGETVMLKGFVRELKNGTRSIPANTTTDLTVTKSFGSDSIPLYQANPTVSGSGSWETTWQIPSTAFGNYYIKAGDAEVRITVGEFRPPSFSVVTEASDVEGDTSRAKVTSVHFHGAPNAGAKVRWKAEWLVDNWRKDTKAENDEPLERAYLSDEYSPNSPTNGTSLAVIRELSRGGWDIERQDREVRVSGIVQGETKLDANGTATLECKSPFAPDLPYGRAKVFWIVDVTSASAETLRGGAVAKVQFVPQVLGVRLESTAYKTLALQVSSFDSRDNAVAGLAAKAELFLVNVKTVKERLGQNLNRYRNFPTFQSVWKGDVVTPGESTIKVPSAGNYVVCVTATGQPNTPQVSDEAMVSGREQVEVGVENESSLSCKPEKSRYKPGEAAFIDVQSPFIGVATVTAETDHVLSRQTIELGGNLQRIAVPVLESFAPNVQICVHLIQAGIGHAVPAERFGSCEIQVDHPNQRLHVTPVLHKETLEPGANVSGTVKVLCGGKPVAGADVMLFAVDEAVLTLGRWSLPDFDTAFFPRQRWTVTTHTALGKLWTPERPQTLSHSQKGFILGDVGPKVEQTIFRKDFRVLAFWNAAMRTNSKGEVPFQFKAPDGLTTYRVVAVAQNGTDQFGSGQSDLRLAKRLQVEPALPDFLRNGDEVLLRAVVRQNYDVADKIDVAISADPAVQLMEAATKTLTVKRGEQVVIAFRARVADDATRTKIAFSAKSGRRSGPRDAEEESLPIHPSVLELRRAVFGEIGSPQPVAITTLAPPEWLTAKGHCDVMLSGSPFLPKLAGLPAMFDGQGSIEKLSTRILAATLFSDTLQYLPLNSDVETQLHTKMQDGLKRLGQVAFEEGAPIWPGARQPNYFATVQMAWAILSARQHNFEVDDALFHRAEVWLEKIITKQIGFDQTSADIRCFALMVWGNTHIEGEEFPFQAPAEELFNSRQQLTDEGRAWLALGLHYLDILGDEQKTLMSELETPANTVEFDPVTFSSRMRAEAIRLLAQSEIQSTNWSESTRQRVRQNLEEITKSSVDLSTQENLWLLLLLNSVTRGEISTAMADRELNPKPTAISKNRISVGWLDLPLSKLPETFAKPLEPGVNGSYLIRATYQLAEGKTPPTEGGLSIERTVRNLTDASRTGAAEAPFQLGDQVLVTYRLNADKPHSYIELEDQLPACFETVNPKLPLIAQYFELPIEAGVNTLPLSHVELRFARTLLYFDQAPPGRNIYSVLARVKAAGVFHWPGTQVRPMYDSRFAGVSGSVIVHSN